MVHSVQSDIKQVVLASGSFGPAEVQRLQMVLAADPSQARMIRDAVNELDSQHDRSPAENVRLGVCLHLLGRNRQARTVLESGDGGALALLYLARVKTELEDYAGAAETYLTAQQAGYDGDPCALGRAEALRYAGNAQEALAVLDHLSGAVEQTAEYLYQRGATVAALGGNPQEVVALYERAVECDGRHAGALFGLAMENDRRGNDETAMDLYKRSAARIPAHLGTLINLGLLYEDRDQFDRAAQCFQRVLDTQPDHPRALLYMRDSQASGDMYYDEDAQKKRDRMSQVLSIPVTDFELSVRSRNCLQKMGIMTLGDLCRCTEQELLSSKNFGETSLVEIKEMLASKGLKLGQLAPERHVLDIFEPEALSADEQALLARSIADLSLSVRARKCMIRLGISTVGELVRRTGDELLECKNFGVTSLNEVRDKLSVHGLKLRGD
jgi:DNA-directed RNA polymerase subunit alpha